MISKGEWCQDVLHEGVLATIARTASQCINLRVGRDGGYGEKGSTLSGWLAAVTSYPVLWTYLRVSVGPLCGQSLCKYALGMVRGMSVAESATDCGKQR